MTSAQDVSYLVVRESSQELNSTMKVVFLDQGLHLAHAFAITANDEVNILELCQNLWNNSNEEVDTLPVRKPRYEDDVDLVRVSGLLDISLPDRGIRSELVRVDCIWDCERLSWIKLRPENKVVLASVTHTDRGIEIPKAPLDQFI